MHRKGGTCEELGEEEDDTQNTLYENCKKLKKIRNKR